MGILPETLFNYLLRLGWGHGDQEEFTREQAIALFDIDAVGKGPSRFDMKKLLNMNGHYLRAADDARLAGLVAAQIGPQADVALLDTGDAGAQDPRPRHERTGAGCRVPVQDRARLALDEKAARCSTVPRAPCWRKLPKGCGRKRTGLYRTGGQS